MPSTSKPSTIRLYVKDGKDMLLITSVNSRVANYVSPAIREQLKAGGGPGARDKNGAVFQSPFVDRESARVLADWMNTYDLDAGYQSQYLTLTHVGSDDFSKLLHVFLAAYHLGISRSIRGDILHDLIANHVHTAQLSASEFKQVHELTGFERGILSKLLYNFAASKIGGAAWPEQEKIEEYCDQAGLRRRLDGIERHILNGN